MEQHPRSRRWTVLTTGTTDAGGLLQYIDTGVNGVPQRFYRTLRP